MKTYWFTRVLRLAAATQVATFCFVRTICALECHTAHHVDAHVNQVVVEFRWLGVTSLLLSESWYQTLRIAVELSRSML